MKRTEPTPIIQLSNVSLGYGSHVVLNGINLVIYRGDFLGIVGPNGSGKTTLLKALLGLLRPLSGSIVMTAPLRFGYVPQRGTLDELYPLTVLDIVVMSRIRSRGPARRLTADDKKKALWALDQLGIGDLSDQPYRLLSGGQKQRVLVARALAAEPDVLVLDEPTNGLDLASETEIMSRLQDLHRTQGTTIIFVTHLINLVVNAANQLALLHDGKMTVGPVDQVASPSSLKQAYGLETQLTELNGYKLVLAKGEPSR
ncbi:MAG: metal ABC transporter ATP-binding protein [Armatimonadetes bacterium]|nr:metal ABC transporter ATP-binding protein [Armatimonadota bacterium]MDW8122512.1 metal ABC transporter ATP-binding protein [Armatimonadota bacterium]